MLGLGVPPAIATVKKTDAPTLPSGASASVQAPTPMETQDLAVSLLDEFRRAFSRMQQLCSSNRQELQAHVSRVVDLMIAAIIRDHLLAAVEGALATLSTSAPTSPSFEPRVGAFFELLTVVNNSIQLIDKRFEETVLPSLLFVLLLFGSISAPE